MIDEAYPWPSHAVVCTIIGTTKTAGGNEGPRLGHPTDAPRWSTS